MTPDLIKALDSASVTLLATTFVPIALSSFFVIAAFRNYGYGNVGWMLTGGLLALSGSIALGILNNIQPNPIVRVCANLSRNAGWWILVAGLFLFWRQSKRTRQQIDGGE